MERLSEVGDIVVITKKIENRNTGDTLLVIWEHEYSRSHSYQTGENSWSSYKTKHKKYECVSVNEVGIDFEEISNKTKLQALREALCNKYIIESEFVKLEGEWIYKSELVHEYEKTTGKKLYETRRKESAEISENIIRINSGHCDIRRHEFENERVVIRGDKICLRW